MNRPTRNYRRCALAGAIPLAIFSTVFACACGSESPENVAGSAETDPQPGPSRPDGASLNPVMDGATDAVPRLDAQAESAVDSGYDGVADGFAPPVDAGPRTWTLVATAHTPPIRWGHAMAYDSVRRRVVVFGGYTGSNMIADTWEYDGVDWTLRTPPTSPPARIYTCATFDPLRQRVVMFGGETPSKLNETWTWDGSTWQRQSPSNSPSSRAGCGLTWDASRGVAVLFGGRDNSNAPTDSTTWEWNGSTWVGRALQAPSPRSAMALAYDPVRKRALFWGGYGQAPDKQIAGLWEYDGISWATRSLPNEPPALSSAVSVFDPLDGATIVMGGVTPTQRTGGMWSLSGNAWRVDTGRALMESGLVWDSSRNRLVSFGGQNTVYNATNETYER